MHQEIISASVGTLSPDQAQRNLVEEAIQHGLLCQGEDGELCADPNKRGFIVTVNADGWPNISCCQCGSAWMALPL